MGLAPKCCSFEACQRVYIVPDTIFKLSAKNCSRITQNLSDGDIRMGFESHSQNATDLGTISEQHLTGACAT